MSMGIQPEIFDIQWPIIPRCLAPDDIWTPPRLLAALVAQVFSLELVNYLERVFPNRTLGQVYGKSRVISGSCRHFDLQPDSGFLEMSTAVETTPASQWGKPTKPGEAGFRAIGLSRRLSR